jgi:hypothetical protein
VAGASNGGDQAPPWAARLVADIADIKLEVDRLKSGQMRYVESTPEPMPDARAVNPDALDPFTKRLWEERTSDTPPDFGGDREPAYNVPERLYLKNDGSYAWLQGDARSRAYFTEKGYHCLSAAEFAEYEKVRPAIVAAQRGKANAYNAIVQLINTDPALVGYKNDNEFIGELDLQTEDQLRLETWPRLNQEAGHPDRPLPPPKRWRSEGREDRDRQMSGVETSASTSKEELEAKLERARSSGRTIEVGGANWNKFRVGESS